MGNENIFSIRQHNGISAVGILFKQHMNLYGSSGKNLNAHCAGYWMFP